MEAMAFPIPPHLPRRALAQDVSSKLLNKIDAVTNKALTSGLAASWMKELDEEIKTTKERLHERIQSDLSEFDRQLATSRSVQTRLGSLSSNIDALTHSVLDSKEGHIPKLVANLSQHKSLAQTTQDSGIRLDALTHLLKCRDSLSSVEELITDGKLDQAKVLSSEVEGLLLQTPAYLKQSKVTMDIQRRFTAAQARNEEQLSEAYTRGVAITYNELVIFPSVQVRQSSTTLPLPSILSSLSSESLNSHLTTLRRDLISHFIDHVFKQPTSISHNSSGFIEHRISHIPAPPDHADPSGRIENVAAALSFISSHIFSALPLDQRTTFSRSLAKPTATSLLNNLLIPCLPSHFEGLTLFLGVAQKAIQFEEDSIIRLLGADANDRPVKNWVDGLAGHYERQRRKLILNQSREIITSSNIGDVTFTVEVEISTTVLDVVPVQDEEPSTTAPTKAKTEGKQKPKANHTKDDAWGFDEEDSMAIEEDGWGFDDEQEEELSHPTTPTGEPKSSPSTNATSSPEIAHKEAESEADSTDAWGWNDDEDPPPPEEEAEETAWDDPWDNDSTTSKTAIEERPLPAPSIPAVSSPPPKVATRLEKAANKGKKVPPNGSAAGSISSPASDAISARSSCEPSTTSPHVQPPATSSHPPTSAGVGKKPARLMSTKLKEYYAVTERMMYIVHFVEEVLGEGEKFSSSRLFSQSGLSSGLGSLILLSAPSVLDLYRALWPVVNSKNLEATEKGIMFSNDCNYLADEVQKIVRQLSPEVTNVKERLEECERSVRVLGESWWDSSIKRQGESIQKLLEDGGQGFTYTGDQDRYDDCEAAINQTLQQIRRLSPKLKNVLTKSKYYTAMGIFVEAALNKMLGDILALPDIPELESHRLSELCRIFNALEGLFVEDPNQPSFVAAYVPSWLKFSYLSELLEATMTDITYLFEQGTLVDFTVDELVRLVRALFSDNPRRTETINKLISGHPVAS